MSMPSFRTILTSGLAGGFVLNLIDTPWSVVMMVPKLAAFSADHQIAASAFVGPYFLALHFVFCVIIAWFYALCRTQYGSSAQNALIVGAIMLFVNRGFGFGNVLLGLMPNDIFLGFSLSFVIGVLAASWVIGRILDRS